MDWRTHCSESNALVSLHFLSSKSRLIGLAVVQRSVWTAARGADLGGQEVTVHVEKSPLLLHTPQGKVTKTYTLLDDLGSNLTDVRIETCHAIPGLQVPLSGSWELVLRGLYGREHQSELNSGQVDPNLLQDSVDSGAITPFGAGAHNSPDALASIKTSQWYPSLSRLWFYQAIADGPFFSVGAGPWQEAFGPEFYDQGFRSADPAVANNLKRQVAAGFAEIEAPLLDGERFPIPFRRLTVSSAPQVSGHPCSAPPETP